MKQNDHFGNLIFDMEICDLILRNRSILSPSLVEKAERFKEESKNAISFQEMILGED